MTLDVRTESSQESLQSQLKSRSLEYRESRESRQDDQKAQNQTSSSGLDRVPSNLNEQALIRFRTLLLEERERILKNTRATRESELAHSTDDLMDETDLAVSEISQSLVFKLRDRERQLLQKIDQAMFRMAEGTFGMCDDCEEPIEPRRLEARPVSNLCIACKEREEHREKIFA